MATDGSTFCYVPAVYDHNAKQWLAALKDLGLHPVTSWIPHPGVSAVKVLQKGVQQASLIFGVVRPGANNATLFFALGYATALGKPIVLVVPSSGERLPAVLDGAVQVHGDTPDREVARLGISRALGRDLPLPAADSRVGTRPLGAQADRLLEEAGSLDGAHGDDPTTAALAELVSAALTDTGAQPSPAPSEVPAAGVVRHAVWIDELQATFGNPVMIEARPRVDAADLEAVPPRDLLDDRGLRSLVVLYLDGPAGAAVRHVEPDRVVLFLPLREFLESLRDQDLASALTEAGQRGAAVGEAGG